MAGFDIIDATGNGYQTAWRARRYFAVLALLPFFLKFVTMAGIFLFGFEDNIWRQALVMVPAYLAEGWMAAYIVRYIFLGERWEIPGTTPGAGQGGDNSAEIADKSRAIKSCAVMYALVKLVLAGMIALLFDFGAMETSTENARIGDGELFAAFFLLAIGIYLFRYIWLYIPLAIGMPARQIFDILKGLGISFNFLGTWLLCFVPPVMVLAGLSGAILSPYSGEGSENLPFMTQTLMVVLQVLFDTLVAVLATAAIAFGIRQMISQTHER